MKSDSPRSAAKKFVKSGKKRQLDPKCISSGRYATIASSLEIFPSEGVSGRVAIQKFKQAIADLLLSIPEGAQASVITELPTSVRFKLVVPAIDQASLDIGHSYCLEENTDSVRLAKSSNEHLMKNDPIAYSIEASSQAEAERIAEAAGKTGIKAIEVGKQLVAQVETNATPLEVAQRDLALSPDEKVSRKTYGRATGPQRTIRFSTLGEKTIGGGHLIPSHLHSESTFSLTGCRLLPGGKNGGFYLEENPADPEWIRLSGIQSTHFELIADKGSSEMELLGHALASNQLVDIDVCIGERVTNKRRKLVPLRIRNRADVIANVLDRLALLAEES